MSGRWAGSRKASATVFSIISVILMVAMSFHVMVGNVGATKLPSSEDSNQGDSADTQIEAGEATIPQGFPSREGDVNPGSVASFSNGSSIVISPSQDIIANSYVTQDGGNTTFWTPYGAYVLNDSLPEFVALRAVDAVNVVERSYFTVQTDKGELTPGVGKVFQLTDRLLDMSYVLTEGTDPGVAAQIDLTYEFDGAAPPKITAVLDYISPAYISWSLVWIVVPKDGARLYDNAKDWATLDAIAGKTVAAPDMRMNLTVETDNLVVNWTDAKAGTMDVVNRAVGDAAKGALRVSFPTGQRKVDPTFITTVTAPDASEMTCQRKTFWYNGNYWLFYFSGSAICWRTSPDGKTWGTQFTLPEGTTPYGGIGFDVASRNGRVGVGWIDGASYVYFKGGSIQGDKIVWTSRVEICPFIQNLEMTWQWPIAVAVGTDSSFWINYLYQTRWWDDVYYRWVLDNYHLVERSFDGVTFYIQGMWKNDCSGDFWNPNCYQLMPGSNGNMSLLHTASGSSSVDYRYDTGIANWSSPYYKDIGLVATSQASNFSAVSSMNDTLHIAYQGSNGYIRYAELYSNGAMIGPTNIETGVSCPSISIDANGVLHLLYVSSLSPMTIRYSQKSEFKGTWSSPVTVYTAASGVTIRGLTSSYDPANVLCLAWTEVSSLNKTVRFASIPLPFGTPGAPSDPWNRDGLSPYGTYFQMNSDYISPGSGLLTLSQTDVSIQSRGGQQLALSRIYQQPRYFWPNGTAYGYKAFPFCNLGQYWSLDLPWMDDVYVYLANGQRYIIQWGNQGNSKEFVCHSDAQFVLRNVTMGANKFYELITSSGERYRFDLASPHKLLMISDLDNYNPLATTEAVPYNCINLTYSGNVLTAMTESGSELGRSISFSYDANGRLSSVTRPDGKKVNCTYATYTIASVTRYFLRSVTDPDARVTTFYYNNSASYILGGVLYPTGGCTNLSFAKDSTPSTEMCTWMVTKESLRNGSLVSSPLIRQTNFDYKVLNGRVLFAKVSNFNETGALQGWNEYIFRTSLGSSTETVKDASGKQMQAKVTWYSQMGQPARADTYLGNSPTVNSTQYMNYDDWGNQIYQRDALGHESFFSYANTSTQNSFQGGETLTLASSGKILNDAFDDWDLVGWTSSMSGANSATVTGAVNPSISPAVRLARSNTGACFFSHTYSYSSANPYFIQFLYRSDLDSTTSNVRVRATTTERIWFYSYNGYFYYDDGSSHQLCGYSVSTWYDICFKIYSGGTYDIYVDGQLVKSAAAMKGSGTLNTLEFEAGNLQLGTGVMLFDNVRIYKGLTASVSGLPSGYVVDLVDSQGSLLDRTTNGTLWLTKPPLNSPPAFMKVYKKGNSSFSTPMTDVWGGDSYSYTRGLYKSNLVKTSLGYTAWNNVIYDDTKPSGSTEVSSYYYPGTYDLNWANDPDNAVSGSNYHFSTYQSSFWGGYASHWHGYINANPGWSVSPSDTIVQFVQLTYGRLPYELAIQFKTADGNWRRAYWGGTSSIITTQEYPNPSNTVRCGPVPTTTGQWLMLTIKASDLGISSSTTITGILYALYAGQAMWDATSKATSTGITISGLTSGMKVIMRLDGGTMIQGTASSSSLALTPYTSSIRAFPVTATFEVQDNAGKMLYLSPKISEIYNGDQLTYSASNFYTNSVKCGINGMVVGTYAFQDYASTATQESYVKYDIEGNAVETKSKLGTGWVYSQAGYDKYGNQVWIRDATGRTNCTDFTQATKFTYPEATYGAGKTENFDWDTSWTAGASSWLTRQYSTTQSYSPTTSIQESFAWSSGSTSGTALYYKDFYTNQISSMSVRMYVDQYAHNGATDDSLDCGIRMRLYDSSGVNYANYTYWLACWYQSTDNRTTTDPYIKVVCGKPTLSTWISRDLYPNIDWTINWTRCDKVRFELYTIVAGASGTPGDQFRVYFDDFVYDDKPISTDGASDNFDSGLGWTTTLYTQNGNLNWVAGGYTTLRCSSSPYSVQAAFSNGPSSYDTCVVTNYRDYTIGQASSLSVKMYVDTYSHGGGNWDTMDSGLRLRLYNSAGVNYKNYTYWFACWYHSTNNKTAPDGTVKVIYGQPPMNQWRTLSLNPTTDFGISWTGCAKVRFELYAYGSGARGDYFRIFFDDFSCGSSGTLKTTYSYDMNNGWLLATTDPLGHRASRKYDVLGRVIQSNDTDGKYTTYSYDDAANKVTVTNELGQKAVTYYDSIGREVKVQRLGTGSTVYSTTYSYSTWQDKPSRTIDAMGRVTKYTYDYRGRVTSIKNNDLTASTVTHDDRNKTVTAIDENGHKTVSLLDLLGRLNTTREYSTSSAFNRTEVTYDAMSSVKTVKMANNQITRMYYDTLGRETSITYPDGYSESYVYDAAGRVLNSTDRAGVVTRTAYDTSGRAIRVIGPSDVISTTYDADGKVLETKNFLGSISYQYDVRDRVARVIEVIDSNSYSIAYGYNDDDSLKNATYPDGRKIDYLYDQYGRNVDIKYGTTKLLNVTYNLDDSIATEKYYNTSETTSYTYNSRGFVQSIVTKNAANQRQLDLNYTYDNKGNVATIRDALRSLTENYYYDWSDRLIRATGNWNGVTTLTYTYDSMGNRLTKNEGSAVTYSYGSYNQLSSDGTYGYAYDRDGNVIWKNSSTVRYNYVYNSFGQMTQVKKQTYSGGIWGSLTTVALYYYDANGARAKTDESGTVNRFVYSGHDPILQVGSDGKSNKYLYLGSKLELRQIDGSNSYVYISDALGSTRKVFKNGDSTQCTFSATCYLPFGKAIVASGSDKVTYAGEIQDAPTGLFYLSARYYDPELGRFYALDSELGITSHPQTLDRYVYCVGNPLIHVDPSGRFFNIIAGLIGAVVGAVVGGVVAAVTQGDVGAAIVGGAIGGLTAGFTCGMSLIAQTIAEASVSSFVSNMIETKGDVGTSLLNAGVSTVFSVGSSAIGKVIGGAASKYMIKPISKAVREEGSEAYVFASRKIASIDRSIKSVSSEHQGGYLTDIPMKEIPTLQGVVKSFSGSVGSGLLHNTMMLGPQHVAEYFGGGATD